jgi:hypothetical protein
LPLGQGHVSGGRGSRTPKAFARLFSRQLPSPVGLSLRICKSCGGRNRTCEAALNGRLPVPTQAPPQCESGWQDLNLRFQAPRACAIPGFATPWQVGAGGFEPPVSCSRSTRVSRLPHAPNQKRPVRVEPTLPPWQGSRLPLHHGRIESLIELSKNRAPGGTRTHVAALRMRNPGRSRDQCLSFKWDQRDSNPHRPG